MNTFASLTARIEELNEELNDRCSEIVELREKLNRSKAESHAFYRTQLELAKKKAYTEGFAEGWQEGRADTDWNLT